MNRWRAVHTDKRLQHPRYIGLERFESKIRTELLPRLRNIGKRPRAERYVSDDKGRIGTFVELGQGRRRSHREFRISGSDVRYVDPRRPQVPSKPERGKTDQSPRLPMELVLRIQRKMCQKMVRPAVDVPFCPVALAVHAMKFFISKQPSRKHDGENWSPSNAPWISKYFYLCLSSAYCGSLWLSALRCATKIAEILEDTETAQRYMKILADGSEAFQDKLWNGMFTSSTISIWYQR